MYNLLNDNLSFNDNFMVKCLHRKLHQKPFTNYFRYDERITDVKDLALSPFKRDYLLITY